jgi:hypothetical protein
MRTWVRWLLAACLLGGFAQPARAVEPEKDATSVRPSQSEAGAGSVPATDLNFDLLGESLQQSPDPLAAQKAQRIAQQARSLSFSSGLLLLDIRRGAASRSDVTLS